MKQAAKLIVVFVVSWTTGQQYVATPCVAKQPEGIICAKVVENRDEKVFKSQEAAEAFKAVMESVKATNVKLDKRAK